MMSLFFEVEVKPGRLEQYLTLAAALKPALDQMGGCLFLDRFRSLWRDNLMLSYQIWQDEGTMTAWRAATASSACAAARRVRRPTC